MKQDWRAHNRWWIPFPMGRLSFRGKSTFTGHTLISEISLLLLWLPLRKAGGDESSSDEELFFGLPLTLTRPSLCSASLLFLAIELLLWREDTKGERREWLNTLLFLIGELMLDDVSSLLFSGAWRKDKRGQVRLQVEKRRAYVTTVRNLIVRQILGLGACSVTCLSLLTMQNVSFGNKGSTDHAKKKCWKKLRL